MYCKQVKRHQNFLNTISLWPCTSTHSDSFQWLFYHLTQTVLSLDSKTWFVITIPRHSYSFRNGLQLKIYTEKPIHVWMALWWHILPCVCVHYSIVFHYEHSKESDFLTWILVDDSSKNKPVLNHRRSGIKKLKCPPITCRPQGLRGPATVPSCQLQASRPCPKLIGFRLSNC